MPPKIHRGMPRARFSRMNHFFVPHFFVSSAFQTADKKMWDKIIWQTGDHHANGERCVPLCRDAKKFIAVSGVML